jgi:hypothetical protein
MSGYADDEIETLTAMRGLAEAFHAFGADGEGGGSTGSEGLRAFGFR